MAPVLVLSQVSVLLTCIGCSRETAEEGTTPVPVERASDPAVVQVAHPQNFHVVRVETRTVPNELHVNGVVAPDVTRTVHVTSLAGGKLVDLRAHLGDQVQRGQVLMVIHAPELSR